MNIEFVKDDKLKEVIYRNLKGHRLPGYALSGKHGVHGRAVFEASRDPVVARRLTELLREKMPFIAGSIPAGITVASLGVGDGEKELIVLKELRKKGACEYCAMDIRREAVDAALARLTEVAVKKTGFVGFQDDLPKLRQRVASPLLLCCLENSFCACEPASFLSLLRANLAPNDLLLIDCHLGGASREPGHGAMRLQAARPLLELGFAPDSFELRTELSPSLTPAGQAFRAKSVLLVQKDTRLTMEAGTLQLRKGEELELGFTYRYKFSQVVSLLKRSRFQIARLFISDDSENLIILARPLEDGFLHFSVMER